MYQTPETPHFDRGDHIWEQRDDGRFRCVMCGVVTDRPPDYPTPADWRPADDGAAK